MRVDTKMRLKHVALTVGIYLYVATALVLCGTCFWAVYTVLSLLLGYLQ
jgi:hypothetical protein